MPAATPTPPAALEDEAATETTEVVITGTGFSGICAAIQLQRAGITDFLLLERSDGVGGVWRDNTYPGAACDIPSHLYCFSFEPNPDFSRVFSPQAEILAYLNRCADKYGLRSRIRFGADTELSEWSDRDGCWTMRCSDGRLFRSRFSVVGAGPLKTPRWPAVPGADTYGGALVHSSQWPADGLAVMAGKRVAVVGTGASAVQIVPELDRKSVV